MPTPSWKDRTSRTVIGRRAGTVSPSIGPRVDQHPTTCQLGQQLVDRVVEAEPALLYEDEGATATMGLVIDEIRKMVSRRTHRCSPRVITPATPTSISSPRPANQPTPPTLSRSAWLAMTFGSRSSRSGSKPPISGGRYLQEASADAHEAQDVGRGIRFERRPGKHGDDVVGVDEPLRHGCLDGEPHDVVGGPVTFDDD